MWLVLSVLFVLSLGQGLVGVELALTDNMRSLSGILWGGVLGTVVGTLFWLIADPTNKHFSDGTPASLCSCGRRKGLEDRENGPGRV